MDLLLCPISYGALRKAYWGYFINFISLVHKNTFMRLRLLTVILFYLMYAGAADAQKRIYVNEYLNIGVGGRGLAMAGTQVATARDATAGYWNPAGLMQVQSDLEVGLMHAEYFSGNAKYDFGSIVKPLKDKKRVVGLSVLRFAIDDIPNTIDYIQPDGSFDETKLKSMSAGDYAFLLSYAQDIKIFKNVGIKTRIGGNAKVIYRHLGAMANAWGVGVDLGVQGSYKKWEFGIMAKDITTTYTAWSFHLTEKEKQIFFQTGNEIPIKSYEVMLPRLNFGIARPLTRQGKPIQLLAEAGLDLTTDGKRNTLISTDVLSLDPHLGLEASYKNAVYLRAGIGNMQRVLDDNDTLNQKKVLLFQPSVGAGVKIDWLVVDYAFTSLQTQSNPLFTHIVSIRLLLKNKSGTRRVYDEEIPPSTSSK